MKDKAVISNDLVHDIFYKIPEIHIHHTVGCLDSVPPVLVLVIVIVI